MEDVSVLPREGWPGLGLPVRLSWATRFTAPASTAVAAMPNITFFSISCSFPNQVSARIPFAGSSPDVKASCVPACARVSCRLPFSYHRLSRAFIQAYPFEKRFLTNLDGLPCIALRVKDIDLIEGVHQLQAHAPECRTAQAAVTGSHAWHALAGLLDPPLSEAKELDMIVLQPLCSYFARWLAVHFVVLLNHSPYPGLLRPLTWVGQ